MVTFVPTPIGNLDDISLRAKKALSEADLIFCEDTRITKKLLNLLQIDLNKKFISMHSHNEKEVLSKLNIDDFNQNIVYVSDAGMPGISDPGALLVNYCQKNSIKYDILPGSNALLTALVASGIDAREFTFFGFLAHKGNERIEKLNEIMHHNKTSIIYESPHRIEKLLEEIKRVDSEREIFLAKELTKLHQTYIKAKIKDIKLSNSKGEWVVIIPAGEKEQALTLNYKDIMELKLPPRDKAKLLSKISDKSTKEIYNLLL